MTAYPYDYSESSLSSLFFCKDSFDAIHWALGSTERTTLPQVMIKGFNFRKKNSYFFGSEGLTRDYLPYNSSV